MWDFQNHLSQIKLSVKLNSFIAVASSSTQIHQNFCAIALIYKKADWLNIMIALLFMAFISLDETLTKIQDIFGLIVAQITNMEKEQYTLKTALC